jgi:hypothetical protein
MNSLDKGSEVAGDYLRDTSKNLVKQFSSAERVRQQLQAKIRNRKKIQGFVTGFGLIAAGIGAPVGVVGGFAVQMAAAQVTLVVSAYIGLNNIANQHLPDVAPDFPGMLEDGVEATMAKVQYGRRTSIETDYSNLKRGEPNRAGMDLPNFSRMIIFLPLITTCN